MRKEIQEYFKSSIRRNKTAAIKLYLGESPDNINKKDEDGMTLMHHLASLLNDNAEHFKGISEILLGVDKLDLSIQDETGKTALHHLVMAVKKYKMNDRNVIGMFSPDSNTSKLFAYLHQTFIPALVKRSKHGFPLDHDGRSALHCALDVQKDEQMEWDQQCLYKIRSSKLAKTILSNDTSSINALTSDGISSLYLAIQSSDYKLIEFLMDSGANPSVFKGDEHNPETLLSNKIAEKKRMIDDLWMHHDIEYSCDLDGTKAELELMEGLLSRFRSSAENNLSVRPNH